MLNQSAMRSHRSRVAVLDLNIERACLIERILCGAAWTCQHYMSACELIHDQSTQPSDVIVLGNETTGRSCDKALDQIRQNKQMHRVPVLVVGAALDYQAVSMMESGADVVEIWPISASVLVARIDALLRRGHANELTPRRESYGAYIFDVQSRHVWRHAQPVILTPKEFKIALFMFRHRSSIVSSEALMELAWGRVDMKEALRRTVAVHVSRIRQKLNLTGADGYCLSFVAKHGYRLLKV
ncbi:response regulator transcription factor [Burkholderia ambifaria]|uniref:response regulator transcription factor n=1 Tax=Burkholderia ambifaria TaxID=152480 RepID=UPI00158E7185|nr:response regulator transcription factor [Burkholderia ambifaria]